MDAPRTVLVLFQILLIVTYGEDSCIWGKYGENCSKDCPSNCIANPVRNIRHCHKETGKCSEGCVPGWFEDLCDHACSKNCLRNICNRQNGLCTFGCRGDYTGDYCNIGQVSVNIMAASVMMWIACLVIATEAGACIDNQHCSDCDNTTGYCLTECATGYFDQKCSSVCSESCKNKTCKLSTKGFGNCTDGCVPGYQGASCNIPCDSPGGNCTACPDGCDGGYCQLGSSCVSGCVDSYYGTDCDGKSGGTVGLYIGLSGAAFGFIVMIVLVVCCKYRQRLRRNRFQQYVTPVQCTHVSADAIDARQYAVVDEAAMYDALTAGGQPASDGYEELRSVHRSDISRDLAHAYTTEPRTTSM